MSPLAFDLNGGEILTPAGFGVGRLSLSEGGIVARPTGRSVDLTGYRILPGIVDLHGDAFERHLAPRRGAMKQMDDGVRAAEAELAANGITTAVLAQFASWEGGLRSPEFAAQVFRAIAAVRGSVGTDLIPQLRLETHLLDLYEDLPDWLASNRVGYVVFNDHLPHDRLAQGKRPPRLTGQALKAGRNPEDHFAMMLALHEGRPGVPAALDRLCARLNELGIRMGSHDDASAADRATWRARGVRISEFPETAAAAEASRTGGDGIILGAPNVVRGGSHKGNASAVDLITMGLCDALASDYHYPSPRRAALMLDRSGILGFADAWRLISEGPARLLGLDDRGVLEPGRRADLAILDGAGHVAATLAAGQMTYLSGAIAGRFFG